jgi:hypothetical protein
MAFSALSMWAFWKSRLFQQNWPKAVHHEHTPRTVKETRYQYRIGWMNHAIAPDAASHLRESRPRSQQQRRDAGLGGVFK